MSKKHGQTERIKPFIDSRTKDNNRIRNEEIPQVLRELYGELKNEREVKFSKVVGGYKVYYKEYEILLKKNAVEVLRNNINYLLFYKDIYKLIELLDVMENKKSKTIMQRRKETKVFVSPSVKTRINVNPRNLVVRSNNTSCIKNHDIEEIGAIFKVYNCFDDEYKEITVAAFYCEKCNNFYISNAVYNYLKSYGIILCRITDRTTLQNGKYYSFYYNGHFAAESILFQMGYSVANSRGLSDRQRQVILACIVDNKIMSRAQIINHIEGLINQRKYRDGFREAIIKWEKDIAFTRDYNLGELRQIRFAI